MKIIFDKVSSTSKPFKIELKGVKLEGTLAKSGYHRVVLDAKLSGEVELDCDRCGKTYIQNLDNDLNLSLSDKVIEDKDDLDMIEFLDGVIDLTYILESEINALKSAYHYCSDCASSDEDFEVEF